MNSDIEILRIAHDRLEMLLKEQTESLVKTGIIKSQIIINEMRHSLILQNERNKLEQLKKDLGI